MTILLAWRCKKVLFDILIVQLNWKFVTNNCCDGCDLEANWTDDIKVHDALLYYLREQAV